MEASHMSALIEKHAVLERQIHAEMNRPARDDALIQKLKKAKLRLKDEITHH